MGSRLYRLHGLLDDVADGARAPEVGIRVTSLENPFFRWFFFISFCLKMPIFLWFIPMLANVILNIIATLG